MTTAGSFFPTPWTLPPNLPPNLAYLMLYQEKDRCLTRKSLLLILDLHHPVRADPEAISGGWHLSRGALGCQALSVPPGEDPPTPGPTWPAPFFVGGRNSAFARLRW